MDDGNRMRRDRMVARQIEARGIRDGGGCGSIIGRNSFQRSKPEALKFLGTVMKIYAGEIK